MLVIGVRSAAWHITLTSWARILECRRSGPAAGIWRGFWATSCGWYGCLMPFETSFSEIIVFG